VETNNYDIIMIFYLLIAGLSKITKIYYSHIELYFRLISHEKFRYCWAFRSGLKMVRRNTAAFSMAIGWFLQFRQRIVLVFINSKSLLSIGPLFYKFAQSGITIPHRFNLYALTS